MRLKRQVTSAIIVAIALIILMFLSVRKRVSAPPNPKMIGPVANAEKAGPSSAYPNPARTPGIRNPEITQENIGETICNPKWSTRSIRPPASYMTKLKRQQIRQWGLSGSPADYEEDHLISLELGGNPTDPRNLWPEAYEPEPGARKKDVVENYLHNQVCSGAMTLEKAQETIVTDWYSVYLQIRP